MAGKADPQQYGAASMPEGRKDTSGRSYMIRGHRIEAPSLQGGLYVVATPIGNLADMTLRALDTLAAADLIACEDTRVTRKLLQRYGIDAKLLSYHDYSDDRRTTEIVECVQSGLVVALVSDAGTPLISDPGYRLIDRLWKADHKIIPVPGASSMLAALCAAGLPTDAVYFAGFLAPKSGERRRQLGELARLKATLVLFESPRRLAATLKDAADIFGAETIACVCRELTKLHETFDRAELVDLAGRYASGEQTRGEIVLLIQSRGAAKDWSKNEVDALLVSALRSQSVRHAADQVAAETGLARRQVYQRALAIKNNGSPQ